MRLALVATTTQPPHPQCVFGAARRVQCLPWAVVEVASPRHPVGLVPPVQTAAKMRWRKLRHVVVLKKFTFLSAKAVEQCVVPACVRP